MARFENTMMISATRVGIMNVSDAINPQKMGGQRLCIRRDAQSYCNG